MNMLCFSIYLDLLWFLSLAFYSFQQTSPIHVLLDLHLIHFSWTVINSFFCVFLYRLTHCYHIWIWLIIYVYSETLLNELNITIDMIRLFFFCSLLIWWVTSIDFWILNQPCMPGINTTQSWSIVLSIGSWIIFADILLKDFMSVFIKDIGL